MQYNRIKSNETQQNPTKNSQLQNKVMSALHCNKILTKERKKSSKSQGRKKIKEM